MGHGREGARISSGERHESVAARVRYYCFLEVDARAGAHGGPGLCLCQRPVDDPYAQFFGLRPDLEIGGQSCPADSVASCTNDTGGFPAAAWSRLQPVFVRNIFATFQELPLPALFVHVRMHNPEERAGSSSYNGEFQSPITAALRHTVYRAKRTGTLS